MSEVLTEVTAEVPAESESPQLTEEEMQRVGELASKIDITNAKEILNYGAATQSRIAAFSETALGNVRGKDLGEVGAEINNLLLELKNFDVDKEEKGLKALFKKQSNKITALKTKYAKVETNVNEFAGVLEKHQVTLLKDVEVLDRMYAQNLDYFREMTMQIMAGKQKLKEVREVDLPALTEAANRSGLPEDAQKAKDLAEQCDRFEKKLYDLELTRTIALQTAPQIRMVQHSDTQMVEKIQSTIVNTIPLWKNQMVIALGVEHAAQAAEAEHEVNDMTNALLKKNAEKLKMATVAAAKESERGIVDIETLQHTNEQLITTLDEVMAIQKEGKEKRAEAEAELANIETQLKEKLLTAASQG